MTRNERSARKELRALIGSALTRETALSEEATRRVVNRILRQSRRIAEIGQAFSAGACDTSTVAKAAVVAAAEPDALSAPASQVTVQVFDPYAIGAVVTLQRHGADALRDRLAAIASIDHLVSLATAQNLALKATGWSDADELRTAIIRSAEQRLAERRAAAS